MSRKYNNKYFNNDESELNDNDKETSNATPTTKADQHIQLNETSTDFAEGIMNEDIITSYIQYIKCNPHQNI